ncbi:MAG: hypothetical protein WCO79_01905 [bacterium]
MESNNKMTGWIIGIVVIVLLGLGIYWLSTPSTPRASDTAQNPVVQDEYVQMVNVKHQYKNGRHTYVGEIDLPTPCHSLVSAYNKDANSTTGYTLVFTSTSTSGMCAQVITSKPFKLSFAAIKNIIVSGTLNGKKLRLNLFEVPDNQNLDSFNVNIKG